MTDHEQTLRDFGDPYSPSGLELAAARAACLWALDELHRLRTEVAILREQRDACASMGKAIEDVVGDILRRAIVSGHSPDVPASVRSGDMCGWINQLLKARSDATDACRRTWRAATA